MGQTAPDGTTILWGKRHPTARPFYGANGAVRGIIIHNHHPKTHCTTAQKKNAPKQNSYAGTLGIWQFTGPGGR
jgi:hypothetical protein